MTPETRRTLPSTATGDSSDTELESDDLKNMYEPCPYCGAFFEVEELVEDAPLCEDISTIKALEISLEEEKPFSTEVGGSDSMGETSNSVSDKDLCPKCRQEFTLLELLIHAAECKEEVIKTSSDANDFPGDEVENFGNSDDVEGPMTRNTELVELCPKCRREFLLMELVNHASECKQEEPLIGTSSDGKFSEEVFNDVDDVDKEVSIDNDNGADNAKDTELCPKCRQEFPLLDLVKHANECKQKEPCGLTGSDVEFSHEDDIDLLETNDANEDNENFVDNESNIDNYNNNGSSDISDNNNDDDEYDEFIDCRFCGTKLPKDVMSDHYSKCEEENLKIASSCLEESHLAGVSLTERTASSLDSYHDCEEQCLYCLKMFPVSVLVEHACTCTGLDQVGCLTLMIGSSQTNLQCNQLTLQVYED